MDVPVFVDRRDRLGPRGGGLGCRPVASATVAGRANGEGTRVPGAGPSVGGGRWMAPSPGVSPRGREPPEAEEDQVPEPLGVGSEGSGPPPPPSPSSITPEGWACRWRAESEGPVAAAGLCGGGGWRGPGWAFV